MSYRANFKIYLRNAISNNIFFIRLITRTPLYIRKKEISLKDLQKINEFNNVSVFSLDKIDQKTKKSYDE